MLALELGRELDVPLPTTAVDQRAADRRPRDGARAPDFAVVFEVLAQLAGLAATASADGDRRRQPARTCARAVRADADDPRLRGAGQRALPRARRCPGSRTSTAARRRSPSASARRCGTDDYITSTHRGHGHCLAKGADVDRMFAELLGKEAGYCRGKGGSMHIADQRERQPRRERDRRRQRGHRDRRGVLGARCAGPTRSRSASSARARSARALLYEVMNMAVALEAAGHLRLREQPLQRVHALLARSTAGDHARARRGVRHPGRARSTARTCARSTRRRARRSSGRGAARARRFLVCETYRYHGHHVGDIDRAYYRSQGRGGALEDGARSDRRCSARGCSAQGSRTTATLDAIERDVAAPRSRRRCEFALDAPYPGSERGGPACLRLAQRRAGRGGDARAHVRAGRQRGARRGAAPRPDACS